MADTSSGQLTTASSDKGRKGSRIKSVVLWIVQGILAFAFLSTGLMKLFMPLAAVMPMMPMPLPGLFVRFLGAVEVLGAIGLILPGLLRIRPILTPLAACGLFIIMLGAVVLTLVSGKLAILLTPLVLALLTAFVVYGRRSLFAVPENRL